MGVVAMIQNESQLHSEKTQDPGSPSLLKRLLRSLANAAIRSTKACPSISLPSAHLWFRVAAGKATIGRLHWPYTLGMRALRRLCRRLVTGGSVPNQTYGRLEFPSDLQHSVAILCIAGGLGRRAEATPPAERRAENDQLQIDRQRTELYARSLIIRAISVRSHDRQRVPSIRSVIKSQKQAVVIMLFSSSVLRKDAVPTFLNRKPDL